jgi:FkbM family methyltransferase
VEERGLTRVRHPGPQPANERALVATEIHPGVRLVVDLADHAIGRHILLGRFELNELDFVRRMVRPGQHVVDVGAHVGLFAMHMADLVGAAGSVHAFEPFEPNAACLELSVGLNGFADRVFLERAAVGAAPGIAQLVCAPGSRACGGAFVAPAGAVVPAGCEASPVRVVALDAYQLPRPIAFLKMDAEGSEPHVVAGALRVLRDDRPVILSEVSPWQLTAVAGSTPARFIRQLVDLGYRCHMLGAGAIGEEIADLPNNNVTSVVFVPMQGRDVSPGRPGCRDPR